MTLTDHISVFHRARRGDGTLSIKRRWNTVRFLQKSVGSYLAVLGLTWIASLFWDELHDNLQAVVSSAYFFWFFVPFLALSAIYEIFLLALRDDLEKPRTSPMSLRPVPDNPLGGARGAADDAS